MAKRKKQKIIRCSSLPRVMLCPASAVKPKVDIREDNEAGRLGTAVHVLLGELVQGNGSDAEQIRQIAAQHRVEVDQLAPLYHIGKNQWNEYKDLLDVRAVETELTCKIRAEVTLLGHPDVVALLRDEDPPTLIVLDFKSGSMARSHKDQVLGYVELWMVNSGTTVFQPDRPIKTIIFWLRDNLVDVDDVTDDIMADWRTRLNDALDHPERFCATPEACDNFCPRQHECPARMQLVQATSATFQAGLPATPEALASLYPQAKFLKRALDQYDAALKAAVVERGTIPTGDGREFYMADRQRKTLDPATVIAELTERGIDPMKAVSVIKGQLAKAISEHAAPRCKGKDNKEFMEAISRKGGVETSTYQALGVRKVEESDEDSS